MLLRCAHPLSLGGCVCLLPPEHPPQSLVRGFLVRLPRMRARRAAAAATAPDPVAADELRKQLERLRAGGAVLSWYSLRRSVREALHLTPTRNPHTHATSRGSPDLCTGTEAKLATEGKDDDDVPEWKRELKKREAAREAKRHKQFLRMRSVLTIQVCWGGGEAGA